MQDTVLQLTHHRAVTMPFALQPRVQKQLQQLRAERRASDLPEAPPSFVSQQKQHWQPSSNGSQPSTAAWPAAGDMHEAERLPTKAELRGTLGTVNRKVHYLPNCMFPDLSQSARHTSPCRGLLSSSFCVAAPSQRLTEHHKSSHMSPCSMWNQH